MSGVIYARMLFRGRGSRCGMGYLGILAGDFNAFMHSRFALSRCRAQKDATLGNSIPPVFMASSLAAAPLRVQNEAFHSTTGTCAFWRSY